jgi:hypothetical protein
MTANAPARTRRDRWGDWAVVGSWPIDATDRVTPTLAAVLNGASLARAPGTTAFRIFDIEEGEEIDEQPTMESTYVFVFESSDLFTQRMPVVVMGLDIAMARGDQAYVFSLLASKDDFEDAAAAFRQFVKAAEIR